MEVEEKEECPICCDYLDKESFTLTCSHTFHKKCIFDWCLKNSSCPICRKSLDWKKEELNEKKNHPILRVKCKAITKKNETCKNMVRLNSLDDYCWVHSKGAQIPQKEFIQENTFENTRRRSVTCVIM